MTEHPKHAMICTASSGYLSLPAPSGYLYLDFEEDERSWRLCINDDPIGNAMGGDLESALQTLQAIDYVLERRKHDHGCSNLYMNDDERMAHANWMEYASAQHTSVAQALARTALSLAKSAETSRIRDRRKTA